jgi:hypothetical protein
MIEQESGDAGEIRLFGVVTFEIDRGTTDLDAAAVRACIDVRLVASAQEQRAGQPMG